MHPILMKHQIIGYFSYVEDILVIYNQMKRNMDETVSKFSKQRTITNFTTGKEQHNSINVLDLTIHCK
jgi:hypothetical protein